MPPALSERQRRILFAAVTEYIATGEPVASRRLQKAYEIDLSPATIRNVLSDLDLNAAATVTGLREDSPGYVMVVLDTSGTRLLARVTRKSADALQLAPGTSVFAQVKGVALLD